MLMHRIIPCLDVRDGRVVKGVQFQSVRDAGDPVELAVRYEQEGADEIVVLDIAATVSNRDTQADTVRALRAALSIPLTVGGGIRTIYDAQRLLECGADKVSINSAAVADPTIIEHMADRFGRQCTVVAVDVRHSNDAAYWEVLTRSGTCTTGIDAIEWIARSSADGAGEILLTSWDRDGTGIGYDLALLRAARRATNVPIIASGGGATVAQFAAALEAGADAVLAATIFHFQHMTVAEVKQQLVTLGEEVRL